MCDYRVEFAKKFASKLDAYCGKDGRTLLKKNWKVTFEQIGNQKLYFTHLISLLKTCINYTFP